MDGWMDGWIDGVRDFGNELKENWMDGRADRRMVGSMN